MCADAMGPTDAPRRFAAIDVGSNSVKMIVVEVANGQASLIAVRGAITRLGEGMEAQAHRLREIPMRRTIEALTEFIEVANEHGVEQVAAVGTAALREAENREEFLRRVREACTLDVAVIPGEEEARLSYLAVRRDLQWNGREKLIVIDIGGGSTEVIFGSAEDDAITARVSINLGAVRLTETLLKSDPPTIAQLAEANRVVAEAFATAQLPEWREASHTRVVGVGGTLTNLGSMYLQAHGGGMPLHGAALNADHLEMQMALLASRTVEERKQIPGLDPRRADIILGGAILLTQALAFLGSVTVDVSTRGLRWGLIYDRFL